MERNAQEQRRLAVLQLAHAADEQAPRDQAGNQREGDAVRGAQRGLVTRTQPAGEELTTMLPLLAWQYGKKANTAMPQASSVIS